MVFVGAKLMFKQLSMSVACIALAGVFLSEASSQAAPATHPRRPHFSDIAPNSKFNYISDNDPQPRKYFPQPMCGGVAILDYDQDGRMDIFFTNGATLPGLKKDGQRFSNVLLHNRGDGTFEDVTGKAGLGGESLGFSFGVAAGDYDNDGYPDLFIANAGKNTLYHNNGDGTFADVTDRSGIGVKPADTLSVQAAWLDYDKDGLLDLVMTNYTTWNPQLDQRCQKNGIEYACSPKLYPSVPSRLYHNLGHGKFEDVTERSGIGSVKGKGMGIAIADFNNDGLIDIFIANDTERNFLFLNQGKGEFKEVGLEYGVAYDENASTVSGMGADAKDYDNDGRVDIFFNDLMNERWGLFHNRADSLFDYASPATGVGLLSQPFSGWSNGFIDYNNDGWKDLYSANGDVDNIKTNAQQSDTMFENVDGRHFIDVTQAMGPDFQRRGYQRGSAFVDLNNDGFMDIVVTSLNQRPRILINSADNGNHWLLLQLTGHKSNRDAIGARIKVTTSSGRTLYNHVTTSVGFMSSSDRRAHFGLGTETAAEEIEIQWPSGIVQRLGATAADQILKIQEPR